MTREVTQAARDAVVSLMTDPTMSFWYDLDIRADIHSGKLDDNVFVQAFARFERDILARSSSTASSVDVDLVARLRKRASAIPGEIADRENEAQSHCGAYGTDTAEDYMDDEYVLLMHDAADRLASLANTPAASSVGAEKTCPKCGTATGNDWLQCEGSCPMPQSPHFAPLAASTTPEPSEPVAVTQGDRAAAWPHRPDCYRHLDQQETRQNWDAGVYDHVPVIQAFARHRLTAQSGEGRSGAGEAAGDIKRECYATAVRDLAKMDHISEALKGVLFDCADLLDAKDEEIANLSCKGGREGAIGDIATERQRQVEAEGWTPEHDDKHYGGELSRAAACYAAHASAFQRVTVDLTAYRTADPARHDYGWPWSSSWWKPSTPRRDLVKAGALIVAEIERLDRAALRATDDAGGAE